MGSEAGYEREGSSSTASKPADAQLATQHVGGTHSARLSYSTLLMISVTLSR